VLRTLPGVGKLTALVMVAEIGDIARFGSARQLASWAGLTPTVRDSDLKVRHGYEGDRTCRDGRGWHGGLAPNRMDWISSALDWWPEHPCDYCGCNRHADSWQHFPITAPNHQGVVSAHARTAAWRTAAQAQ